MGEKQEINDEEEDKRGRKALKEILIVIIVFAIISAIGVGVYYMFVTNIEKQIVAQNAQAMVGKEEIIESGSSLSYKEIVNKLVEETKLSKDTQVKVFVDGKLLEEDDTYTFKGKDSVEVKVETSKELVLNQKADVDKEVTWKVGDSKKPVLSGVKDRTITVGEKIDVKEGISANDDVDGKLEVNVTGEIDVNKAGTYTLVAKAVDKSNNEVEQTFKITVKEKEKEEKKESDKTSSSKNSSTTSNKTSSSKNSSTTSNKTSSSKSSSTTSSKTSSSKSSSTTSSKTSSSKSSSTTSSKTSSSKSSSTTSSKTSSSKSSSTSSSSSSKKASASTKSGRLSLAKAEAKKVVAKIIKPGMTQLQKAEAICNYITDTVAVQGNQSSEAYKTNYGNEAYAALVLKIAACSGRCKAVTLLCDAAGLTSKHINAGEWTHQWNRIKITDGSYKEGTWVTIDSQIGYVGLKHPLED